MQDVIIEAWYYVSSTSAQKQTAISLLTSYS